MRTTLLVALLCAAGLHSPCARAQQNDAERKKFLEYKVKAEQGDAATQFVLGLYYYSGEGTEKDYVEAVKWFRKSAVQNDAEAQFLLGSCYFLGQGLDKDDVEAYAWFNLAAQARYNQTRKNAEKFRDALEEKLSSEQVGAAQKRTKELRTKIKAKLKSGVKLELTQ